MEEGGGENRKKIYYFCLSRRPKSTNGVHLLSFCIICFGPSVAGCSLLVVAHSFFMHPHTPPSLRPRVSPFPANLIYSSYPYPTSPSYAYLFPLPLVLIYPSLSSLHPVPIWLNLFSLGGGGVSGVWINYPRVFPNFCVQCGVTIFIYILTMFCFS